MFRVWQSSNPSIEIESFEVFQELVFSRFITHKNRAVIIEIYRTFKFSILSTLRFKNLLIQNVQGTGDYTKIAGIAHEFGILDSFELKELLLPFLFCNPNMEELITYLKEVPNQAVQLIKWIDQLNVDMSPLNQAKLDYDYIKRMNLDRLSSKPRAKLIKELIHKLNLDEKSVAPRYWEDSRKNDLRYHIRQVDNMGKEKKMHGSIKKE